MMKRAMSGLGLAMRAGKLVSGEEAVLKSVRAKESVLVVIAADASPNTKKKFHDKCTSYEIPYEEWGTREALGSSIGKPERAIVAVTDEGFAKLILGNMKNGSEVKGID